MKNKNWLMYFIYALIFACYILFSSKMIISLDKESKATFNIMPVLIWSSVLFIGLGLLLGVERFLLEIKKEGRIRVNLPKIIFLGLPSLYFSLGLFLAYSPIMFFRQTFTYPILRLLLIKSDFLAIFQIIFGYVLITSFVKVKRDEEYIKL
ncbi:hypothetical protein [Clostridium sp. 'White wine YQ']|uniref:hypothetical protein n=1 Tax=Clostridium sp. 'White wine YQ' TaxID=3027474 RepID=UPI0023653E54|nr:hypothetical protein [Clostridium sp. 'White wine YQ']MDD7794145.1 hypothetical protein [Clostridium sp. 'White wine YQ']